MAFPLAVGIWAGLSAIIVPLAVHLLVGLGIGLVTYAGVGGLWNGIQNNINAQLGSVEAYVLVIVARAGVDDFIATVLSAGTAKLALKGLTAAGALRRIYWVKGGPLVLNP